MVIGQSEVTSNLSCQAKVGF